MRSLLLMLLLLAAPYAAALDNLDLGFPETPLVICIVDRDGFALGYSEEHEQAAWVCYRLTREEVTAAKVPRNCSFTADPDIHTGSAKPSDYTNSGYDRGHLAPAADMAFSSFTMELSFRMSNMSPQAPALNRGAWRMLEEHVRELVKERGDAYVMSGPVLKGAGSKRIGASRVTVPDYFFKAVLLVSDGTLMCWLLPNDDCRLPLYHYAVSEEDLEAVIGFRIFPKREAVGVMSSEDAGEDDGVEWIEDEPPKAGFTIDLDKARQKDRKVSCRRCGDCGTVACGSCRGSGTKASAGFAKAAQRDERVLHSYKGILKGSRKWRTPSDVYRPMGGYTFTREVSLCTRCKGAGRVPCRCRRASGR